MIATDLQSLLAEIRDAQAKLKPHIKQMTEIIRHTAGRHFRAGEGSKPQPTPENYAYTFKSFVKPQLLFGRPVAKVVPNSPLYAETAKAIELGINAWAKEIDLKGVLEEVLDDVFAGFGVTHVGLTRHPHYHGAGLPAVEGDFEMQPMYPFCVRVAPEDFIFDARARNVREARVIGHSFRQDLDDVLADDRNDPEALAKLAAVGGGEPNREPGEDPGSKPFGVLRQNEAERRRVTIYEVYLPEHGLSLAIAELSTGKEANAGVVLRQEPYYGPDEGPYTVWGLDSVSGEPVPLSPLTALWDEFLEVCEHSKTTAESARTHKKLGIFEPAGAEDAKRIVAARAGTMVPVKSVQSVKDFEIGGASANQIEFIEWCRGRLERNLGFGPAQQGVAGKQTATGEQIAAANSDLRIDRMRDHVATGLSSVYRKAAWFFMNSTDIPPQEVSLPDDNTGQVVPATYFPGPWEGGIVRGQYIPPEIPSDFTDYHFEIDPSSMVKTDSALEMKRAQDELALCQLMAGMGVPINWRRVIDRYGDKSGTKDLSRIILLDQGMMPALPPDPLAAPTPAMARLGPQPGMKPAAAQSRGPSAMPQLPQAMAGASLPAMLGSAMTL